MNDCTEVYRKKAHFEKGVWIPERELRIYLDDEPNGWNPRTDFDNFGHMLCFHKRYDLGDATDLKMEDFSSWDDVREYLKNEENAVITIPLYLYDHSGITIRADSTLLKQVDSFMWDWGQVGFIYCTREDLLKEFDEITVETPKKAESILLAEVEEYDKYLTGDVYGYILLEDGEEIDSCWGFYEIDNILDQTGMNKGDAIS